MTRKELDAALRANPQLSTTGAAVHSQVPDSKCQLHKVGTLEQIKEPAAGMLPRITVRIISRRVHLLDAENLWAGTKDLVDGLRYSGLLPNDGPADIKREVEQEKVSHFWEEQTLVEIIYPAELKPANQTTTTTTTEPELWQERKPQQQTQPRKRIGGRS